MSKEIENARFTERMKKAGFKNVAHLASSIVLNVPMGASFPLSANDIAKCATDIENILTGKTEIVDKRGVFSALALEIATLLNAPADLLFKEFIGNLETESDYDHHETPVPVNDHAEPVVVHDVLTIRHRFNDSEWNVLQCMYIDGLSPTETASHIKCSDAELGITVGAVDKKLKSLANEGLLANYTNDPADCFYGGDWRDKESHMLSTMAEKFRQAAKVASLSDDPMTQNEVIRAQNIFMVHALKRDNFPFLRAEPNDLVNVIQAIALSKTFPQASLIEAWRNSFEMLHGIFTKDQLTSASSAMMDLQLKLADSKVVHQSAYPTNVKRIIQLAIVDVIYAAKYRPF